MIRRVRPTQNFRRLFCTQITTKAVRQALIDEKGYTDDELPCENTMGNILKRMGYKLKRIQKTKPLNNIPETDDIFENVTVINRQADGLELWWEENKERHTHIKELVINPDNVPHINSHKTQFIKRIIEFADKTGLKIRLVYYPPYHSKYNSIERCWGVLEVHWNGSLLSSIHKIIGWAETMTWNDVHLVTAFTPFDVAFAETMTWNDVHPAVHLVDKVYQTGIKLTKEAMNICEERIERLENLPKWDVTINPILG